jgi:hypothetical protein
MVTVIPALALIAIVGASLHRVLPSFDSDAARRQAVRWCSTSCCPR